MATVRTRSSGGAVSSLKSSRVMKRLQQNLVEGSFYEAHQTYRALYQRLCAQGSEEQAINLLLEGASTLLKHSQVRERGREGGREGGKWGGETK